jgi:hypothetical protein
MRFLIKMGQVPTMFGQNNNKNTREVCIYKYNSYVKCDDKNCNHEKIQVEDEGMDFNTEPNMMINCTDETKLG